MSIPFVFSGEKLNVFLKGKTHAISITDDKFEDVYNGLKDNLSEDELFDIINKKVAVLEKYLQNQQGVVELIGDEVFVNGEKLHHTIVERVLLFRKNNLPFEHMLNFISKISENPSYNSREQLYGFLENKDLVITEDGDFLAYKAVTNNYLDKRTRKINNSVGQTVKMDRSKIDDNPNTACGKGLHVGAMTYVKDFADLDDKVVVVKVNPKNVVSVPTHANYTKCRVCEYYVLMDSTKEVLDKPLYTNTGDPVAVQKPNTNFSWEWTEEEYDSYEDDDYDEDDVFSYDDDEDYHSEDD